MKKKKRNSNTIVYFTLLANLMSPYFLSASSYIILTHLLDSLALCGRRITFKAIWHSLA